MEARLMIMGRLKEILLILRHLWRYVARVMTKFISTQKKVEKEVGCYDPYNTQITNKNLDVDVLTCQVLAELYDDPKQNNFDYPWDWKENGGGMRR